jgi:hypothetical protein
MNAPHFLKTVTALCLTVTSVTFAELKWGGSYENTLWGYYLNERSELLDENRLRLDMNATSGSAVSFTGDIIFKKHFGRTTYDIASLVPSHIARPIPDSVMSLPGESTETGMTFSYGDTFYVDNAALTLETGRTLLTAGIQQLPWGCGYAWNPTDLWNIKDILDPGYDKPGKAAIKLDQGIGPVSFTAVAGFAEDYMETPWTVSLSSTVAGFEATALTAYRTITFENQLYGEGPFKRERYLFGYSLSGQILEIGIHSEGAWNREIPDASFSRMYDNATAIIKPLLIFGADTDLLTSDHAKTRTYQQIVAGADYTFGIGSGLFIMSEYFYNGDGKDDSNRYTVEDWMEYMTGDNLSMGKHTLLSGISYPVTDLSTFALYVITNISDRSVALNPWLTVSISDDCELDISGAVPIGDREDEFGRDQYMGRARVKVFW